MDIGNLIFLSYRRADSAPQTLALKLELESHLRAVQIFLDTRSIQGGDVWPSQIQEALSTAKVILAVMGKSWTGAVDGGKPRINDPEDWVHRELSFALRNKKSTLIPVLVDGALYPSALPPPLDQLSSIQALKLQVGDWDSSVESIVQLLQTKFGFEKKQSKYKFPIPDPVIQKTIPYPWSDLETLVLQELRHWRVEFSDDAEKLDYKRVELARDFEFRTFEKAMEFVGIAAKYASEFDHHPRWMNVWKSVTVWLSTWDAGHRITVLDVNFAKFLERKYKEF